MKKQKKELKKIKETKENVENIFARFGNAGITLIALIITIVVILILAGVSITMLTGDNGILTRAAEAKEVTGEAEIEEKVNLAVSAALMEGLGTITETNLKTELTDYFGDTGYTIEATSSGLTWTVTVDDQIFKISSTGTVAETKWYYDDDGNITDGTITLEIGDVVNYDEQNQTTVTEPYVSEAAKTGMTTTNWGSDVDQEFTLSNNDVGWQVLGLDEDSGEILLVSDSIIYQDDPVDESDNENWYYLYGREGYENGVSELNAICKIFGYGTGASGARALTQDDVDTVLGFDLETTNIDSDYTGEGKVWEPGAKVTVSWSGTSSQPTYSTSTGKTGTLGGDHSSGFWWYANGWQYSAYTAGVASTIATIENKYSYWYYGSDVIDSTSEEYKLIFFDDDQYYWLGSAYSDVDSGCGYWGLCLVCEDCTGLFWNLADSNGYVYCNREGVRPVVSLNSTVSLESAGTSGEYNISE